MNATTQHDFHPDAESLSAFAEQALGARERGQVLKHLAVCGRCRQVVALAQEAGLHAEARPVAAERKTIQPSAWWRTWRFVWAPAAVAVALAVASFSVYLKQLEQSKETIKIAEQTAPQNQATASTLPPQGAQQKPAPSAPAAAPRAARPSARSVTRAPEGTERMPPSQEPVVTAAMPAAIPVEPSGIEHLEASREEPTSASGAASPGFVGTGSTAEQTTAAYPPKPAVEAWQSEQRQMAAASAPPRHLHAAKAVAPENLHGAEGGATGSSSEQFTASVDQLQAQAQPAARFAKRKQPPATTIVSSAMKAIHLPSGLPAVSMAAVGHRTIAIDEAGTLFLREDAGKQWRIVTRQWTGLAVAVRAQLTSNASLASGSAAQGSSSTDTGAAPSPASFFEILNDKSQAWVSTDGETWVAK